MYLKKVEIQGFKSFGDLVKLNIPPGITAVIGPNGCGKSNIADAMRWVLGEQSAKLLRGERMQDVIFSGTQSRRGVGYAQVSMTIDNSEGKLQIDYSEVVITRRVYRSGESEYLINKSPCRLRDIHEVFMGTGVGKEGYSIIGQGQIDKVLSSRPEDRRNLFEEAAGIYKYKLRKLEAEKKLDKKQENLIRVQDILKEVEGRLETLEQQAEKAKKYMNVRDSLRQVEVNIFIYEADKIEKELLELTETFNALEIDYEQNNTRLKETKNKYDQIREQLSSLQEESCLIQNKIMTTRMSIEQSQSNLKLNAEKIKSIDEAIKRLKDDEQKRNDRSKKQDQQKQLFYSKQIEVQNKIKKEQVILSVLENDYRSISDKVIKEEDHIESCKNKIHQGITRISNMETALKGGDNLSEQIVTRKKQIDESLARVEATIDGQKTRSALLRKDYLAFASQYENTLAHIKNLEDKLILQKNKQKDSQLLHRSTENLYHQSYSRHSALAQMKNEHEGFFRSVKNILNLKKENPKQWANIYGVVGQLIKVPEKLETALDVALGNSIQHIVTKDEQTANLVIEYIKKHDLGRATFLPLSAVKGYSLGGDKVSIPKEEGVIGFANTLIDYDQAYSGIVDNLLGRVVIVDHMKNAISLAKKYRYRYRIVTLQGEILNPGGSITGGNFHKNKENIFSRDREVRELKEEITKYKDKLDHISEEQKEIDLQVTEISNQLTGKQIEKADLEKQLMELRIEGEGIQTNLKQVSDEKSSLEKEKENLKDQYNKMHQDVHHNEELLKQKRLEVEKMQESLKIMEQEIREIKAQKELMGNQITDFKVSLSSNNQILKATQEQTQSLEEEMADHINEQQIYHEQVKENNQRKQLFLSEIETFKEEIKINHERLAAQKAELDQVTSRIKSSTLEENEKRQGQDEIIESNALLKEDIYRVENKINKLNLEKENIFAKVWEKYELTYQKALGFKKEMGNISELRKMASEDKAKIRSLGIINTSAIEEYDEIKERYEFMRGHEQDILSAEKTLLKLIENLTQSMEVIFKEQFQKISDNFNVVFTELFGGGKAFLELTDSEDVLESGIEIIAQPPGKKLQNMMLLSGGERSLTAIAILFGILRLKPSPFAVLDEIEAALDDANVVRFSNYLKGMGENMQFLIITHRKGTMAVADTIYGVTMEEKGVSKVISVQLDEAQDYTQAQET